MCPKCKSRERRKAVIGIMTGCPNVIMYVGNIDWMGGGVTAGSLIRWFITFVCSNCGYELGRWG